MDCVDLDAEVLAAVTVAEGLWLASRANLHVVAVTSDATHTIRPLAVHEPAFRLVSRREFAGKLGDVSGLLRAMAKSLCAPPPFVDMDPPEAGNVINSSWNDGNPDHADYFASTGGISAAEARAQLSEWVSRCERAAQLLIAAEALDRKDV